MFDLLHRRLQLRKLPAPESRRPSRLRRASASAPANLQATPRCQATQSSQPSFTSLFHIAGCQTRRGFIAQDDPSAPHDCFPSFHLHLEIYGVTLTVNVQLAKPRFFG